MSFGTKPCPPTPFDIDQLHLVVARSRHGQTVPRGAKRYQRERDGIRRSFRMRGGVVQQEAGGSSPVAPAKTLRTTATCAIPIRARTLVRNCQSSTSSPTRYSWYAAVQRIIRSCIDSKETAGSCQTVCGAFLCSYRVAENVRQTLDATTPHRNARSLSRCTWLVLLARKC